MIVIMIALFLIKPTILCQPIFSLIQTAVYLAAKISF